MRRFQSPAGRIALCGVLAALAVSLMFFGAMIPASTFCCPVLASLLLLPVMEICGIRLAWPWYGAVAILSVILSPDKEAAGLFLVLGEYPILKPWLDRRPPVLRWLLKLLLFNGAVAALYAVLIFVLGLEELAAEAQTMRLGLLGVMLILGNVTFLLLDRTAGRLCRILRFRLCPGKRDK